MNPRSDLPIVVGGCHRSGTSLLRRVLNGHPRIDCPPEVPFFRDFFGEYRDDPLAHLRFSRTVRSMVDEDVAFAALGSAFVDLHATGARARGKCRWADKTPENAIHLDDWERLLGDRWLYVHAVRNPLDTIASIDEAGFPLTIPSALAERIAFYTRYTAAGLDWVAEHPQRACIVVYEHVARAPEHELGTLMRWLGESFHPHQLEVASTRHGRGLEDPKIAASGLIHARSVGAWRQRLAEADARAIWDATATLWQRIDPDPLACMAR